MGKTFTTSNYGNKVMAEFNKEGAYLLSFADKEEAIFFERELMATQQDLKENGRDHAKRKKSIFLNPADCSVSMNFDTENTTKKWTMRAELQSSAEAVDFFNDIQTAIYGPMVSL